MAFRFTRILKYPFAGRTQEFVKETSNTLNTYDRYRMTSFPKFPVFRAFSGIVCVSGVGFALYTIFKKPIHKYFSSEGSVVAAGIVNSPEVQSSVKSGMNSLMDDKEIADKLKVFFKDNLEQITREKWFSDLLSGTGTQLVRQLSVDKEVNDSLAQMFIVLFDRDDIKNGLAQMFIGIFNRPDIVDGLHKLIIGACEDSSNRDKIADTLKEIMLREDMKKEMATMLRSVVVKAVFG